MVFYSYTAISAESTPLLPNLNDYLSQSPPKNADARRAALLILQKLSERTALPVSFPILKNEYGKPFFDANNAPDFNLSHSGNLAACILGTCRVGIDLQEEAETLETQALAARFFGKNEQNLLRGAPHELFFALWTKKEALGKCLGTGLVPLLGKDSEPLAQEHSLHFVTERIFVGNKAYTLTACATEPIAKENRI